MYSYEDRLRAVKLYIKLGKRAGLTIRQLGYPTKNSLKDWYQAYEQSRDLPRAYTREPKSSSAWINCCPDTARAHSHHGQRFPND